MDKINKDKSETSTNVTKESKLELYKNKIVIKGITLILTEIIEENIKTEKKKLAEAKKHSNKNIRSSVKGIFIFKYRS